MVLRDVDQNRWVLGLDRTRRALDIIGHPEHSYTHVLVAGTNGKGSTCVYLERLLLASGISTGTTLSPHLSRFTERFRVNGVEARARDLARIRSEIEPDLASLGLTYFEWCVVLAAVLFQRNGVGVGIFEVGLGGRYDASNALDPHICLITGVSLDHTEYLGTTLTEIAREKAQIARKDRPLMTTATGEALAVLREHAGSVGALLHVVHRPCAVPGIRGGTDQRLNAALAVGAAGVLGACPDDERLEQALRSSFLPGRIEQVGGRVIMDVAHNASSVLLLVERLRAMGFDGTAVVGILADKDYHEMVSTLRHVCAHLYLAPVASPRSWGMQEMMSVRDPEGITICESVTRAFGEALRAGKAVVVTGSFHTVSEVRETLVCRGWPA